MGKTTILLLNRIYFSSNSSYLWIQTLKTTICGGAEVCALPSTLLVLISFRCTKLIKWQCLRARLVSKSRATTSKSDCKSLLHTFLVSGTVAFLDLLRSSAAYLCVFMISSNRHKQSISMAISAKELLKNHTDKERFAAASSCIATGIVTLLFPRKRRRSSSSPLTATAF